MAEVSRVLVVEDEPNVRRVIHLVLTEAGFPTDAVDSAEAAWDLLVERDGIEMLLTDALTEMPAVVVSDIKLPGMNGGLLARAVLRRWPATRILFVSGYGAEELVLKGVCPCDMPLLAKPFGPEALLTAVRNTLARPPWFPKEWREVTDARD